MSTFNDGVPISTDVCVTYGDALEYISDCQIGEFCATQQKVEDSLADALELVESITSTRYCPYTACKTFDGEGDCYVTLHFKEHDALSLITSVKIDDVLTDGYEVETFRLKFNKNVLCCSKVEICGTWGSVMPRNVKKAIIMLALEYAQPGIVGIRNTGTGADKVLWSDFSIEYNDKVLEVFGMSTGYNEIDKLLLPFIPTISQINFTSFTNHCPKDCCKGGCICEE